MISRTKYIYSSEQYENEISVINTLLIRKFPELGKCNNKAVDLLLTTSYLIFCDYLEFSTGSCPDFADKLSDIEEQTNKLSSSSDSDIDFGNEIIQRAVGNVGLKRKKIIKGDCR